MAGSTTIKGITIEFGGDVTPLQKALRKVKDETKSLDSELKQVNHALKLDPKNVDLLRQKQELLKNKVKLTKDSLEELKQAQKDMDAAGVDKNSEQYRKLQREINNTEQQLKSMKGELNDVTAKGSKLGQLSSAFGVMSEKLGAAAQATRGLSMAAGGILAAFAGVGLKAANSADDIMTLSKQTGIAVEDLQLYAAAADLVDVSVETLAKSQSKLKKSMLTASEGGATAQYFEQLGVSVTDANGNLRDSNDVFMETIAALGNMENETERDAIAMQIFGKSASELNPLIEDAGQTYAEVSQMLSEHGLSPLSEEELQKANEFKDTLDTIKLVAQQAIQIVGSKLAGVLQPVLEQVLDKVTAFAEWLSGIDANVLAKILAVIAAVAALSPILAALSTVFGVLSTAIGAVSTALTFLSANPVVLIIAAIAALIAVIVLLVKNWDTVKEKALEVWNRIKEIFGGVAEWFREKFSAAWEAIKEVFSSVAEFFGGIWETIKSKFTDLAVSVGDAISGAVRSGINGVISMIENTINGAIRLINGAIGLINKIPGVSIGTLGELSLPRLAKGGVLYGAQTVIAGEAGPEAIIPLDRLFRQMDKMAETIAGTGGGGVTVNVYATPGMDINALAREIERRIIETQNRRRLAWQ